MPISGTGLSDEIIAFAHGKCAVRETRQVRPGASHRRLSGNRTYFPARTLASSTGRGLAPLDERLGITHGHTPACEYHVAQFVDDNPYRRSWDHFHQIFRPAGTKKISLHKIDQMVDALGAWLEDQRQQEITAVFEHSKVIAAAERDHRYDSGVHRRWESADQGQRAYR